MLGAAVRTHRRQMGFTQEELAWRADMHRTYLADIERGVRNLTLRSVANLAKALQMSVEGLLFQSTGAGGPLAAGGAGLGEVLLVDGNSKEVELTLRAFKHAKFTNPIRVMPDGESALEYLFAPDRRGGGLPQLVLLDLVLPKISAVEVLRRLKARKATQVIPVIMLSATRGEASLAECSRLGAASYLVKPLEFENFTRVASKLNFQWALLPPGAASLLPS